MTSLTVSRLSILAVLYLVMIAAPGRTEDAPGCRDHPALTRMSGFHLDDCEGREFDSYVFRGPGGEALTVEGRKVYLDYGLDEGVRVPSELQILRNHTNAVEAAGGTVLHRDAGNAYMRLAAEDTEIWIHVRAYNQGTAYSLYIIEKEAIVQEVTVDAESMARDLANAGKVALYGIYFDFDKAELRPESEPALREIARLLRENPHLKLHVVGHTDNIGTVEYNLDLSRRRAEAVVTTLTSEYGVSPERLRPAGVGPLAPAAPNASEDGRAMNRRVELVEQ